jgi:hypothetical protein
MTKIKMERSKHLGNQGICPNCLTLPSSRIMMLMVVVMINCCRCTSSGKLHCVFWMYSSPHPMTQHHMLEDVRLYQHHCENLKSCMSCSHVPFKWITHGSNSKPTTTDTDKAVPDHCTIKIGTQPSIFTNFLFAVTSVCGHALISTLS